MTPIWRVAPALAGLREDSFSVIAKRASRDRVPVGVGTTNRIWRDLPDNFGPLHDLLQSFRSLAKSVWAKILTALAGAHDTAVQMIDTSIVRVHQHGACITRNRRQSMGRSRGGLTSKIHAPSNALHARNPTPSSSAPRRFS